MLDELFQRFEGAFAPNTIKAYRADFEHFSKWCEARDSTPFDATPDDLAEYIAEEAKRLTTGSVRRRVASLSSVLTLCKQEDITRDPTTILALKRMHREKGYAQRQATPLTRIVLEQLLEVCDDGPAGQRDRVMLLMGYETMRRRAELCSFRFEDREVLPNGNAGLRLKFSKTDQYGYGKLIPISQRLHQCLNTWGETCGGKGPILKRISKNGIVGEGYHPSSMCSRLQDLQLRAGLKLGGRLTGHSFRVGAALDLLEAGEPLAKIMLRGGWQSESTVIRYLREWQALESIQPYD